MKVTFVTTHMNKVSGVAVVIQNLANSLIDRGFEVRIVAQTINKKIWNLNKKIIINEVGGPLPISPFYWMNLNKGIGNRYLNCLSSFYSDFIVPQLFPTHYFCGKLNKKFYGKIIYYCHEPYRFFHDDEYLDKAPSFQKYIMKILKILYNKFDIEGAHSANEILCNSEFIKKKIRKIYNLDSHVVYPFPKDYDKKFASDKEEDFEFRKKLVRNKPYVFTIGLSSHSKGVSEMMKIFYHVLLKKTKLKLIIGGNISNKNFKIIKKEKKRRRIPDNSIILYGYVNDRELALLYQESILTFYTAIDESFGLIPVESMKNGTPVIAFEGGPSETIVNNKTGYIIEKNDITDFVNKTISFLNNIQLQRIFSDNAKIHSEKNFSYSSFLNRFIHFLTFNSL